MWIYRKLTDCCPASCARACCCVSPEGTGNGTRPAPADRLHALQLAGQLPARLDPEGKLRAAPRRHLVARARGALIPRLIV
jgi:hypothetical protein